MHRIVNGKRVDMTEAEILATKEEWAKAAEQKAKTAYIAKRVAEYGSMGDQLDMIFHDGIEAWKTHIAAVKAKYPKPTE